jgi:hypothetical protein
MAEINQGLNPKKNSEISIEAMISSPLVAASKANAEMVLGQTQFLLRNCFQRIEIEPEGSVNKKETNKDAIHAKYRYEPIMIQMSLTRNVINTNIDPRDPENGKEYMKLESMDFNVPLLCLIPINSLVIDKVTVDFDMEVTSTTSWKMTEEDIQNSGKRVLQKHAQLNGKIASEPNRTGSDNQYKKQSSSHLKVHINASPLPLPLGLLSILELYSNNVNPVINSQNKQK